MVGMSMSGDEHTWSYGASFGSSGPRASHIDELGVRTGDERVEVCSDTQCEISEYLAQVTGEKSSLVIRHTVHRCQMPPDDTVD